VNITHACEALTSVVHTAVNLSVIVSHLLAHDLFAAVSVTIIGCLCLVGITIIAVACEIIRWKVRTYIRVRESPDIKPGK
jgi:hypothetical protein